MISKKSREIITKMVDFHRGGILREEENCAIVNSNYRFRRRDMREGEEMHMEFEQSNNRILAEQYRDDVMRLCAYIPWLEAQSGQQVSGLYHQEGDMLHTIAFPIYDPNLLAFVKEAGKTQLMDRNYRYVYSRNRIRDEKDELRVIGSATMAEFPILSGILSRYVMLGNTKGTVWTQGVTNGVFLNLLRKMKELVEFWGHR